MHLSELAGPLLALAVVVLLVLVSGRFGRALTARLRGPNPAGRGRLRLVDSAQIDVQRRLVLLACDRQEFLVLLGPQGDTHLDRVTPGLATPVAGGQA